jgi:acetyl esterase/lipase
MIDPADVVTELDLIYADGGRPLRWNVFRPAAQADDAPVVLLLHGGGWRGGDRAVMTEGCLAYAREGYVAIAPEYRFLGEAPWPAPLNDARTAIRAVRAKAGELRVSRENIFLTGYSAGAHLALLAASGMAGEAAAGEPYADQPEQVAGVAAFFPPARIEGLGAQLLGVEDPATLKALSPITYADRYPPTIVFCGDGDTTTPPQLSIDLYRAIRDAGGVSDLRLYANQIHEFVMLPGMKAATVRDAAAFFQRTVLGKAAYAAAEAELVQMFNRMMAEAERQA